ncbi:MAG: DegV family protein, partial [Lachnospiraceae bacterium]|nr:DegV family protein [Lachnospiraceae bacterium]
MSTFQLTCCSTADLTDELFSERNIAYVCFHFTMDGVEYADDLGKSVPFEEFYRRIAAGSMPVTSQVSTGDYIAFWEPFLKEGKDILHVTLSSGISGTINSANTAKEELADKYPDRKILILDSLGASSGYGLFMIYLADLRDEGKTIDEVYEWGMANRLHMHHWFFSTDLTSYYRGGRISRTSAAVGTILGICPLMNMDDKGHLVPRRNVRLKKRVIQEIVKEMEAHAQGGTAYSGKCMLSQSACIDDAKAVVALIEQKFPALKGKIIINWVGGVIGSHTG